MCVAPQNPSSRYANNYGFGSATGPAPTFAAEERQWYVDNGFGDPLEKVQGEPVAVDTMPYPNAVSRHGGITRYAATQYYRGISPEARVLYNSAADRAKAIRDVSAQYAQERENRTNVRAGDAGVRYNYAGAALGIPG